MKKCAHVGVSLLLLSTIPNFAVHAESHSLIHLDLPPEFANTSPFIQKLFTEDNLLSYDAVIELIESIENDTLGPCTPEDEHQIGEFIAYLARSGVLPDASEIEKAELEYDISEMLAPGPWEQTNYWIGSQEYSFIPAVYYYDGTAAVPCKSWIHKQWKHIKHFVHEHKTAVIVGSILLVAAVVVVATVMASSAAAAAAAGAVSAAASDPKDQAKETKPAERAAPQPQTTVAEQVIELKETASQANLLPTLATPPDIEQVRALGSTLTHEVVQALPSSMNQNLHHESSVITAGHGATDLAFATDQAPTYLISQFWSPSPSCNLFLAQGEQALKMGNYDQAVEHFNQAIDADPKNNEVYLERAYAYVGADEFSAALSDYRTYNASVMNHAQGKSSSIDFCVGFAKGLPKGVCESGEGLARFVSDLVTHPVRSGEQMWDALSLLSNLARSEEWGTLSQVLAPEIHQLVKEWNTLPSDEKGELAGYAFGKYGADIVIPGALAKAVSNGVKGAQELSTVYKGLQTAEKTLILESISGLENGAKVAEIIQSKTITIAEKLGFNTREIAQLENIGKIEGSVAKNIPNTVQDINFTNHALQRAVERGVSKESILDALASPLKIEEVRIDSLGRPSQRFIGQKAEVVINPETQQVVSVNPTSTKKFEKLNNELSNVQDRVE